MKKSLILFAAYAVALMGAVASAFTQALGQFTTPVFNPRLRQGGFVVLGRAYQGYPAGSIVELPASTEAAMIASGSAQASVGPPTPGNVSTTANSGCVGIAAGQSSVTITHPNITAQSLIWACVAQAAADATLLRVERILPAAGSVTIYGTAAATATTLVDWAILNPNGSLSNPQ